MGIMPATVANPLRVSQELIDAEIRECPAMARFWETGLRIGIVKIVEKSDQPFRLTASSEDRQANFILLTKCRKGGEVQKDSG